MKREATLSNLLNQTFAEIGEHRNLVGIFLAFMIPVNALSAWFEEADSSTFGFNFGFQITQSTLEQGIVAVIVVLAAFVVMIAMSYWLYAGMVRGTSSPGFDRIWPWIGIYILSLLGIVFGIVLLVVPGIILAVRWAVVLPLVIEGKIPAMDTFGESWSLTRGRGWSIFGAAVILVIGMWIVAAIIAGFAFATGGLFATGAVIAGAISETFFSAVFIAFSVGAYRLLRDDSEELAEVFG